MREKGNAVLIGYILLIGNRQLEVSLYPGGYICTKRGYVGKIDNPSPRRAEIWCAANLNDFRSVL